MPSIEKINLGGIEMQPCKSCSRFKPPYEMCPFCNPPLITLSTEQVDRLNAAARKRDLHAEAKRVAAELNVEEFFIDAPMDGYFQVTFGPVGASVAAAFVWDPPLRDLGEIETIARQTDEDIRGKIPWIADPLAIGKYWKARIFAGAPIAQAYTNDLPVELL